MLGLLAAVAVCAGYFAALAWAGLTDARTRRIPNESVALLALCGLAVHALAACGAPVPLAAHGLLGCVVVAAGLIAVLLAFNIAWRARGHTAGMGMGDVKLMGAAALMLGAWALPCIAASCLAAGLVETLRGNKTFAFGPYLCASFAVCFLCLALSGPGLTSLG